MHMFWRIVSVRIGEGGALHHCLLYLSVVQLSVHIDLTLSDVASEIRDRVSDVCRKGAEGGERQVRRQEDVTTFTTEQ